MWPWSSQCCLERNREPVKIRPKSCPVECLTGGQTFFGRMVEALVFGAVGSLLANLITGGRIGIAKKDGK